jgi:SAM-dependent methyltransferase
MTTGPTHEALGRGGARDWAQFMEPHFQPVYALVQHRLGIGAGTGILDIGCGPGGAARLAAQRGARVAGLDAAPGAIALARERVADGDFRVGDMERLPWPDGSFDAVTCFNSMQFAGSPVAALSEARRVLAVGGMLGLLIWAPREHSQQPRIMAALSALAPPQPPDAPGPFALSAPGRVEAVLEAAGLRLVERGEVAVIVAYADAEAACRAMMAGSAGVRAVQHSGEERVRQAILEARRRSGWRVAATGWRTVSGL